MEMHISHSVQIWIWPAAAAGTLGSSEQAEEADHEGRAWIHLQVSHTDETREAQSRQNPDKVIIR